MNVLTSIKYVILFSAALPCISCESYLGLDPPNDRLARQDVFADSASASLALVAIHSDMVSSSLGFVNNGRLWTGLMADELDYSGSNDAVLQFRDNNVLVNNSNVNTMWVNIYKHIYQCNSAMEGVESSLTIPSAAKSQLIAEARFLRSLLFFYALNCWGDVPLTITTDYRLNEAMARTPVNQVYAQIVEDLRFAVENLPESYLTSDRARPNKYAATALLARAYLYQGEWKLADQTATLVIGDGQYALESDLSTVFLKSSSEVIWQLAPATSIPGNTPGADFLPFSMTDATIPTYFLYPAFYEAMEDGDARKSTWVAVKQIGPYYLPFKYRERSAASAKRTEFTVLLRLAEQYLIRAEARAQLKRIAEGVADINQIRQRASTELLETSLSQSDLLLVIEQERRKELFTDWGAHRWFDLKRTGRADVVLGEVKGANWQVTDNLLPVPLNQMLANPFLVQNQGY